MEFVNTLVNQLNGVVWGPPMLVLILGTVCSSCCA